MKIEVKVTYNSQVREFVVYSDTNSGAADSLHTIESHREANASYFNRLCICRWKQFSKAWRRMMRMIIRGMKKGHDPLCEECDNDPWGVPANLPYQNGGFDFHDDDDIMQDDLLGIEEPIPYIGENWEDVPERVDAPIPDEEMWPEV